MRHFKLVAILAAMTSVATSPMSRAYAAPPRTTQTVAVGDSLEQVSAKLHAAGVRFGQGGFAFSRVEDQGNLYCPLDEQRASAAIFYSHSRQVVTQISVVFFPAQKHTRLNETWVGAKSIIFEPDGSYRIHFTPTRNAQTAAYR